MRETAGIDRYPALLGAWQTSATFVLVTVGWVFFRATSVRDALYVLSHLLSGVPAQLASITSGDAGVISHALLLEQSRAQMLLAALAVFTLLAIETQQSGGSLRARVALAPAPLRWTAYAAVVLLIMTLGVFGSAKFIYFQF